MKARASSRRAKLAVTISASLRHQLEDARKESGYTLSGEVEARLRDSLRSKASDGLILLRVDDGLMAWLRALDEVRFFGINLEETVQYLLRNAMMEISDHDAWHAMIVDRLPEPWRSRNQETPRYKRLAAEGANKWPWEKSAKGKRA